VALSLCSSVPTALLEQLLTHLHLDGFFRHIGGGAADKVPVLQRIVGASGFRPDQTLYVGDTPHDIEAAHAAGVIAGAALYGYATEDRLRAERPDHAFADVRAIIDLIDREHLLASERRVIARLLAGEPRVLATGGGAYMDPVTRANISARGISIWLKAELDTLKLLGARHLGELTPAMLTPEPLVTSPSVISAFPWLTDPARDNPAAQ
jgi:hypothetical protein